MLSVAGTALLASAFSIAPISSADAQTRYVAPPPSRLLAPPPSRLAPAVVRPGIAPPPRIVATPQTGGRLIGNDGSTAIARNNAAIISRDGAGFRGGNNLISPGNRTGSSFR